MVFQDIYFWLGKINELKDRDKYSTPFFNNRKYSRDKALPKCDNLTSNQPSLLCVSKSRSPLNKEGTRNLLNLPRIPEDLKGDRLENQRHSLGVIALRGHGLTRPLSDPSSVRHSTENRSISVGIYLFVLSCYLCLFPGGAIAQIIPDNTLGAENSRTVPDTINNLPSDRIEGGATRGSSLFHSLREFNIGEGRGAYFDNPSGITNIFTRVTGGNQSNILGTLGVLGNANLFLINPKGIVFGPNARLDVRGSFLATTADSIVFDSGMEFSSANPQGVPLLTVNIPVGLSFREQPGAIVNASSVTEEIEGTTLPVGLAVPPGQTLAMVGGDVIFDNGFASAFSGNIQLGSVASPGFVSFNITPIGLGLDYTNVANFGNIELSGLSAVTASGPGGGAIALRGGNVTLRDGSSLVSDTLGSIDGYGINIEAARFSLLDRAFVASGTIGSGAGGPISIRTAENIELKGIGFEDFRQRVLDPGAAQQPENIVDRQSSITTGTVGAGRAGDITLDTKRLTIQDGAAIFNPTLGTGDGGNVTIRASESVEINGSGLLTPTFNSGNAGSIAIETGQLSVSAGALVSPSTFGAGNSGNLIVTASDSVIVARERSDSPLGTGLSTNSIGGTGRAGNIEINTRSLRVEAGATISSSSGLTVTQNLIPTGGPGGNITINATESVEVLGGGAGSVIPSGSLIDAGTVGSGKGGDVTLNARRLILRDGGSILASTLGTGAGGNVTITADESVEIAGTSTGGFPSTIGTASVGLSTIFLGLPPASGAAGNLSIAAGRLTIRDGARLGVQSDGTGAAGSIHVVADSIALKTKGIIDATNILGIGGNINLRARDIQLLNNSRITTDSGGADGGNITLNSEILVGRNNSDITANAKSAAGGRVNVKVPNILGFAAASREQVQSRLGLTDDQFANLNVPPTSLLNSSDIAAISQSSGPALQGTVTFSASGVNPAQGLVELPQNIVAPAALIAANPCTKGAESAFTITGKGGLPLSPNDTLSSSGTPWTWVEETGSSATDNVRNVTDRDPREFKEIRDREVVPARGWVVNAQGEVMLVANQVAGQLDDRTRNPLSLCVPR
ncbi:two-partner secretion domain-containing protein [Microcoleus sp. AR_TQ3_B6]|uniref:two-partner secretion domain-containing protein n=1 Tax=Microcoleus sp. AR_TQ3_B6 TaxID=3055284 RepID=UPI002FD1B1BC